MCIGVFNEILSVNEKEGGGVGWGGVDQFSRKITNFRDCLENMGLRDLGYTRSWST